MILDKYVMRYKELLETQGKLYDFESEMMVGYWYNPLTRVSHTISWQDDIPGTYTDHCDVAMEHPEWFGIPRKEQGEYDECEIIRWDVVQNGWVRIGYSESHGLSIGARNPREAHLAFLWFVSHHGKPSSLGIDIYREPLKSYGFVGKEIEDYANSGRLEPSAIIETALSEMPISIRNINVPPVGKDGVSSFHDDDRAILHSDKARLKLDRVWKSSVANIDLYTFDIKLSPDRALQHALNNIGFYDSKETKYINRRLARAQSKVELRPDAISVLLTNNHGADRLPLTGWMIAHRLFHAMSDDVILGKLMFKITDQYAGVMGDIRNMYENKIGAHILKIDIAHRIGTTRACRMNKLTNPIEIIPESFAQYLLTGKVKFNPLPATIKGDENLVFTASTENLDYINQTIDHYARFSERVYAELIETAKGHLFTL